MQRFGIHKFYRASIVLGAIALIIGISILAGARAKPAHALLDSCDVDGLSYFLNDYDSNRQIGLQQQIKCSSSNAEIIGTACLWVYIPFYDDGTPPEGDGWHKFTGACDSRTSRQNQTLYKMIDCFSDPLASWKYQARASWVVHFPDGNYYGYNKWTTTRTIPCQPLGGVAGPGGGK